MLILLEILVIILPVTVGLIVTLCNKKKGNLGDCSIGPGDGTGCWGEYN